MRMLRDPGERNAGTKRLADDVFAPTTRKASAAREKTINAIAWAAGFDALPATAGKIFTVAAALKEGGYRSGASYLALWAQLHLKEGYSWTAELGAARTAASRSIERGIGPGRKAVAVELEQLARSWVTHSTGADMGIITHGPLDDARGRSRLAAGRASSRGDGRALGDRAPRRAQDEQIC